VRVILSNSKAEKIEGVHKGLHVYVELTVEGSPGLRRGYPENIVEVRNGR
jgi:hypothetical protein